MEEMRVGVQLGRVPAVDWDCLPIIELTTAEQSAANQFGLKLGRGEAECITLAQARHWLVLTDDRDARRVVRNTGITVSGTLGALMNLVRSNKLSMTEADTWLALMKQRGYRCSVNSLSELDSS